MTFAELVKKVAKDNSTSEKRTRLIIRQALKTAADAALLNNSAPVFVGVGRFVPKTVRSHGRKADGTTWEKPGRVKLGLTTTRVHARPS